MASVWKRLSIRIADAFSPFYVLPAPLFPLTTPARLGDF